MEQDKYHNVISTKNHGAFGRIAQPYSGAAPCGNLQAKLERDEDFYNHFVH